MDVVAQQVPITRFARFTGNVNFVATGGSLRTESDIGGNSCAVGASSSRTLSGIPAGASIVAAYLYWGGSGSNVDATVALNGSAVSASRTFQAVYPYEPTDLPFFGGFADVTSRVSGNGTYTFSGLSVNTGAPHCSPSAVQAGWGLIAIYGSPAERLRAINVFDGLQYFRGSALTLTPNGFRIPATNIDGRVAVISWEGDPGNSDPLNGFSESLRFNGTDVDDGLVPAGSSPSLQQYDGTVNSQAAVNSYGADIDTYDVSSLLTAGSTSATTRYSAGGDLVLLTAQVVSATSEPLVDLSLDKTHAGDFAVGTNASFTLTVTSEPGSQPTDFPITVTDTMPSGLTYVSGSGLGWTCGATGQLVTCTHTGPLNPNASLPPITLTVAVGAAAFPGVTNTAQVTTPSNDPDSANNTATDLVAVVNTTLPGSGTKQLYLRAGNQLHRTPPTAAVALTNLASNQSATWTLAPALSLPLTLAAGAFSVPLWLTEQGNGDDRTLEITLSAGATQLAQGPLFASNLDGSTPELRSATLTLPSSVTIPAGQAITMTLRNTSGNSRDVRVHPFPSAGNYSRVELNSLSVINVDSVTNYSAAYSGGALVTTFNRAATAYIRAVVSDPFGSFDIRDAVISILDPSATIVVTSAAMTQVADSGAATRTYEYAFAVPNNAAVGTWTARVVAREGTENTVSDLGIGTFNVVTPALAIQKASAVISDPVNAASNPKRIPGSVLRYTITVTNSGQGSIDASSLVITDPLPTDVELCVAAACGGPLSFADGVPSSGLGFTYASNVTYSATAGGGAPFTHPASATPQGYDPNIRGIRIAPTGVMNGASGVGSPSFSVSFYVRVR